MSTSSLANLSFEHLDTQVELFLEQLSVENGSNDVSDVSLENHVLAVGRDYHKLSEVLQGMRERKGVCKDDVLELESLRGRYGALDTFLTNVPVGMFTQESSTVMYDVSMESFIGTAVSAIWKAITAFAKWVWGLLQSAWNALMGLGADSKKVDAKLKASESLCSYVSSVESTVGVTTTTPASVVPKSTTSGTKAVSPEVFLRKTRDDRIQDINRDIRENEIAFLRNPSLYDGQAVLLSELISNYLPTVTQQVRKLIEELGAVTTADDVRAIKLKYEQLLANQPSFKEVIDSFTSVVYTDARVVGSLKPDISEIGRILRNSPICKQNNAKGQIHPNLYTDLIANPTVLKPLSRTVKDMIEKDLPEMVKTAKAFSGRLTVPTTVIPEVAAAFSEVNFVETLSKYQHLITAYTGIQSLATDIVSVHNSSINKFVDTVLKQVKVIDKWISDNKDMLSVDVLAARNRERKQAMDAVSSARL